MVNLCIMSTQLIQFLNLKVITFSVLVFLIFYVSFVFGLARVWMTPLMNFTNFPCFIFRGLGPFGVSLYKFPFFL